MPFIGNTPQTQSFAPAVDYFSGNGVTVTFTLSRPVVSVAQLTVAVDNVIQNPSSAFTVSGNSITFTSAPLSGTNNIWVEYTSLITTYAAISQDPSVIGDITATGGFLAEGDFGNSYIDGTIVDYVTGNARITTGPIDDMTFYHGGTSGRSEMMRLSYAGNSYIVGNLGVGTITNPDGLLTLPAAASNTPKIRLQSATSDVDVTISSYADSSGTYAAFGSNFYLNSSGDEAVFDSAKRSSFVRVDGRSQGAVIFGTAASGVPSERMRIDSSGNVGIGTSSPTFAAGGGLNVANSTFATMRARGGSSTGTDFAQGSDGKGYVYVRDNADLIVGTNNTERMRITSGGALCVGTTATTGVGETAVISGNNNVFVVRCNDSQNTIVTSNSSGTATYKAGVFCNNGSSYTERGNISVGASSVTYNTTSDYRLKEDIAPMTGALAKVAQLKPCTYTWKSTGETGEGFIAHELAEIVSQAVTGEKDAVDEEGNPKYQGVDTSFLVATLTAAIQELKAEVDSLKAQLEAK